MGEYTESLVIHVKALITLFRYILAFSTFINLQLEKEKKIEEEFIT